MRKVKGKPFNYRQDAAITAFALTGDEEYSRAKAGYNAGSASVRQLVNTPAARDEILRIQSARLFDDLLPAAINCHLAILTDDRAPAGARVAAVKLVYDRTFNIAEALEGREPHEMNANELGRAIERLKQEAAARAAPIIEATPSAESVFD